MHVSCSYEEWIKQVDSAPHDPRTPAIVIATTEAMALKMHNAVQNIKEITTTHQYREECGGYVVRSCSPIGKDSMRVIRAAMFGVRCIV